MKIKLSDIIIILLFILSLTIGAWYVFGDSPTFEQTLLVFILATIFTIGFKLSSINTQLNMLNHRFNKLGSDFTEHIKKKKH